MLKEAADCCGIIPPPPPLPRTCCYYAVFDANGSYTIYDGVSYIGLDADNVGDNVMPSLGGFGNVLINNISTNTTTCTLGFILSEGDPIPTVDIKDDLGNPVVLSWVPYCKERCYAITVPMSDPSVVQIFTNVEGYTVQTWPVMTGVPPSPLDLSDPAYVSSYGSVLFKRLYGPQCVLFLQNDGVNYTVSLSNIYTAGPPSFITGTATYTASIGACATTPQTYCYFITEVTGSCSYSYQDRYGSVFNAVSSPTVTSVCAADGTVVANCLPGNSIDITGGTSLCFSVFDCTPPPPVCFHYIFLPDDYNNGFFDGSQPWELTNAVSGTHYAYNSPDWNVMMVNSPYGGGFAFANDPFIWTNPNGIAWMWVIQSGTPEALTGFDAFGNDITGNLSWRQECTPKCFEGEIDVTGSPLVDYISIIAEAFLRQPFQGLDFTDPILSTSSLTSILQLFFGPGVYAVVTDLGGSIRSIQIYNVYTSLTQVDLYMSDTSVWSLLEIPCP